MRITYLLGWADAAGGTVRTVFTQAGQLAAAGHDVEVVSVIKYRAAPRLPLGPGVRLGRLIDTREGRPDQSPGREVPRGENAAHALTLGVERAIIDYVSSFDRDILVTTRPALNLLSARYGNPGAVRVGQEHARLLGHKPDVIEAIRTDYPRLDLVTSLTAADHADYAEALPGTRLALVPNALPTLEVPRADPDAKLVVAAGSLRRLKGFDLLIDAFSRVAERHPDWRLRIYGSGYDQGPTLRKLINKKKLYNHAYLMGFNADLNREFAKASVFALSSRTEGFGMVLLEAMSQGLAAASFDCPHGPSDILTHGRDGLLVPPRDVRAMAETLCELIGDRRLRVELGERAVETARAYGPGEIARRWETLFGDLLSDRAARLEA